MTSTQLQLFDFASSPSQHSPVPLSDPKADAALAVLAEWVPSSESVPSLPYPQGIITPSPWYGPYNGYMMGLVTIESVEESVERWLGGHTLDSIGAAVFQDGKPDRHVLAYDQPYRLALMDHLVAEAGWFRQTPQGQAILPEVVSCGSMVEAYGSAYVVMRVSAPYIIPEIPSAASYPHYTLTVIRQDLLVDALGARRSVRRTAVGWLNELVAVDGRLLPLFAVDNKDEVRIVGHLDLPEWVLPSHAPEADDASDGESCGDDGEDETSDGPCQLQFSFG